MPDYLRDFRSLIRRAHDPLARTCHWTATEELSTDTLVAGAPGPCECPSRIDSACSHGCVSCASTAEVLSQATEVERAYAPLLASLATVTAPIDDAIRAGNEAIRSLRAQGRSRREALEDSVLTTIMRGRWAPDRPAIRSILDLDLDVEPSTDLVVAGCRCVCLSNKLGRLAREKQVARSLIEQAGRQSEALEAEIQATTPTFSSTLGRVLKDSCDVVKGVLSNDLERVATAATDLLEYAQAANSEGGVLYALYKCIQALAQLKKTAMLAVIYHDQQLKAPTCRGIGFASPIEKPGQVMTPATSPPPATSTPEAAPPGVTPPPADQPHPLHGQPHPPHGGQAHLTHGEGGGPYEEDVPPSIPALRGRDCHLEVIIKDLAAYPGERADGVTWRIEASTDGQGRGDGYDSFGGRTDGQGNWAGPKLRTVHENWIELQCRGLVSCVVTLVAVGLRGNDRFSGEARSSNVKLVCGEDALTTESFDISADGVHLTGSFVFTTHCGRRPR